MLLRVIAVILCFQWIQHSYAQDIIELRNPSFEDMPRAGNPNDPIPIKSWTDCGAKNFPGESPPDIHPVDFWEVKKAAVEGDTYLGMVVRDNDSYESISQRLPASIVGGQCYSFSIALARSNTYKSHSQKTREMANYTRPAVLRIWGGAGTCNTNELLAESETVSNQDWATYQFEFEAERSHRYLVLEAFFKTPTFFSYNGHLLIDNASDIVRIPCDDDEIIAQATVVPEPSKTKPRKETKPEQKSKAKPNTKSNPDSYAVGSKPSSTPSGTRPDGIAEAQKNKQRNTTDEPSIQPKKKAKSKLITQLDRNKIRKGQKIKIENLFFKADSFRIEKDSYEVLDEVYDFLDQNRDIVVEIGGHTNGNPGITNAFCDRLSTDRARSVSTYLIRKGISPKRIEYKGYGKRKPIATNRTLRGRTLNQRVEIKILNMDS